MTAIVNKERHLQVRRKILPKSFSAWLREKEDEEINGKAKHELKIPQHSKALRGHRAGK